MRTAPKIALSLLASLLLFSALVVASYAGLFTLLETQFYQPSVAASLEKRLDSITVALDEWHESNFATFSQFVEADSVKRSLLPTQNISDITDRERQAGELLTTNSALAGIRIIDSGEAEKNTTQERKTRRIHYSTFNTDIIKKDSTKISYVLYGQNDTDLPYEFLQVADAESPRLVMDSSTDHFIYSYPFHDAYGTWRGSAVFYVPTGSAVQHLFSKNLLRLSDDLHLIHTEDHSVSGVVLDLPRVGKDLLINVILDRWSRNDFETGKIVKTDESGWMLVSSFSPKHGITGQVVSESVFSFSAEIRVLFLAVSFLTVFLIVFLLFNLRQDDLLVIRSRIRRFQFQLLQELMETNDSVYPEKLTKELKSRKRDINSQIKKGFPGRVRKKHDAEIDELLAKSWDEILAALGQQKPASRSTIDANDIKLMLEEVLQNNAITLKVAGEQPEANSKRTAPLDEVEELSELDEVEELSELDEVEELSELDEVEELSELDEVEELSELDEAEELSELDEVEELSELDEAEELSELDEAEQLSELDEAEELSELSEAEELSELDEAEELSELGEVEELSELGEAEELAEIEEFIDIAEATNLETISSDPIEATEVEYLEGEWEPELLEVATEEELNQFVQESFPDSVLVYNFEESPALDTFDRPLLDENETILDESFTIGGLDFSILDEREELSSEVEYLDPYPTGILHRIETQYNERAVYEFLEVIGDEEPSELLDLDELPEDQGQIVNRDGIFIIADKEYKKTTIQNEDFQTLVDSVLRES